MFQDQITTQPAVQSTRWTPTIRQTAEVEAALDEANIAFDELYHNTARRDHWQIEVNGGYAKRLAHVLSNREGFFNVKGFQDYRDDETIAFISFKYEAPEEFDRFFWVDRNEN